MKSTWRNINKLMGRTRKTIDISLQSDGEIITEPVEVANQFNNYFSKIADNIRDTLPAANKDFKSYLPWGGAERI